MVLLTLLTALLVLVFFGVLAYALVKISSTLKSIGGTPTSYLAKLRLGLRAIEKETSHLAPQVTQINGGLKQIAGGLASVDKHLVGTIDAVVKQEA
jgi:predicted PurR-regulated permease PerM